MTVQATWRMADGVRAIGTVAIYFSDLSCLWPVQRRGAEEQKDIPPGSATRRVSRDGRGVGFCLRRNHTWYLR